MDICHTADMQSVNAFRTGESQNSNLLRTENEEVGFVENGANCPAMTGTTFEDSLCLSFSTLQKQN